MVNRERFLLDVDSEGFPQRYDDVPHPPATLAALNVGRSADHAVVQALLADHKCLQCEPAYHGNPKEAWVEDARELVREADQRMDGIKLLSDSAAPDAYFGWKS